VEGWSQAVFTEAALTWNHLFGGKETNLQVIHENQSQMEAIIEKEFN
jgi:hypothetical protein